MTDFLVLGESFCCSVSRLKLVAQLSKQPAKPLLIPVKINPVAIPLATESLLLRLSKGYSLELPGNISPRWLAEFLQCLG